MFTREQIDSLQLCAIDRAADGHDALCLSVSMLGITRQLQAAQQCYKDATIQERPKSNWRENIKKKITDKKAWISILKVKNIEKELFKRNSLLQDK
ncbi:hypothetical protein PAEPH01_2530 [Pancytospora epiphaga]|nr:hypothetical protein PAEPH01_2530 [Pancytospora epiphaga]